MNAKPSLRMIRKGAVLTFLLSMAVQAGAAEEVEFDPMRVTEAEAINCTLDAAQYHGFALSISGADGIAAARGWRKITQPNSFVDEYELPVPIVVEGYSTRRIAFGANAIVAVLDLAEPGVLASREGITNAVDEAAREIGLAPPEPGTFHKFMGERVLVDETEPASTEGGYAMHEIVARTISNVVTHPSKTFYGCFYRIEMLDENGQPL